MITRSAPVSTGTGIVPGWLVWCPGCDEPHALSPLWSFDGNLDTPTFEPSILQLHGDKRCHSFLRGGVWEFLSDSTHALAGLCTPVVQWPDLAGDDL